MSEWSRITSLWLQLINDDSFLNARIASALKQQDQHILSEIPGSLFQDKGMECQGRDQRQEMYHPLP